MASLGRRLLNGPSSRLNAKPLPPVSNWWLLASYAPDWIFTIVLLGLVGYFTDKEGYKREFSLRDPSIQHTFAVKERISFPLAIGLAGGVPAGCILIIGTVWRRSFWDVHNGILGLLLACATTTVVTQIIKITVGRPRPDMLDRCQPMAGAADAAVYGLSTVAICTVQTGHIILDGFRSFPSGHASFSFAGLGYLSLYLAGKMHLFDRRGYTIKAWFALAPLVGASLIAISRTMDYRHHATDVLIGGILGLVLAIFCYHLYYPSLTSPSCHLPFAPRRPSSPKTPFLPSPVTSPSTGQDNPSFELYPPPPEGTVEREANKGGEEERNEGGYREARGYREVREEGV